MKQYFSRLWTGLLITFFSFSFISSSYAIDIKLWDLSGRQGQDEFYELLIAGCETILPLEVEEYLDFINDQFVDAENLEDQNVIWDFQDILLLVVPQIFCPEYIEKGKELNTYIYFADFKF